MPGLSSCRETNRRGEAAPVGPGIEPDSCSMCIRNGFDDGQAEAAARRGASRLAVKAVKHAHALVLRDARAGIDDSEQTAAAVRFGTLHDRHIDRAAFRRVAQSV